MLIVIEVVGKKVKDYSKFDCYHGHIGFSGAKEKLPNAHFITWIREPLSRAISYYNYAKYTRNDNFSKQFKKDYPTFMSLIRTENIFLENEISSYILDVNDFHFIGILENYKEDLERLYDLMAWNELHTS